jgi:glycine/D-amino acid oxidase-like deaminating enzyme
MNASEFNEHMKALEVGKSLRDVLGIFGLPLAHVPASVFAVKPGSEFRELGLDFSFPAEAATEYLVYRHPTRGRMLKILGFREGRFCGGSQQTFTSDAEEFMHRQIRLWREQSLSPVIEE